MIAFPSLQILQFVEIMTNGVKTARVLPMMRAAPKRLKMRSLSPGCPGLAKHSGNKLRTKRLEY